MSSPVEQATNAIIHHLKDKVGLLEADRLVADLVRAVEDQSACQCYPNPADHEDDCPHREETP